MSTVDVPESYELVVGPDGGIPAEQLARLGLRPGAYLRVVNDRLHRENRFGGSMPELPEVSWEDFERGRELACSHLNPQ